MERRELDAVPVDLADVEVRAHFGDFGGGDVVCGTPDALGRFVLGVLVMEGELGTQTEGGSRGRSTYPSVRGR